MAEPKKRLTPQTWRELHNRGLNNTEIAEHLGLSRQAVSMMLSRYGLELPKSAADRMWPWLVPGDMQHMAPYKNLRRHAHWMSTGRDGMSISSRSRVTSFYRYLEANNLVVAFDPETPPIPGVSSAGGWSYEPRVPSDGNLLIRINDLVIPPVDEEFRIFWSFPQDRPKFLEARPPRKR